MGKAALLGKPVFGLGQQFRDRMPGEEFRRDGASGGLLGNGLGAVLAELGQFAATGLFGPRAARAIEAVALIQAGQHGRGTQCPHLFQATL